MKLTPRYDYYLNIDGEFYPVPYKIWTESNRVLLKIKDTEPILVSANEDDLYEKFELKMNKTLMLSHIGGELWKMFPKYKGSFSAETARFVAYPHQPLWKKLLNKIKFHFWNII